MALPAGTTGTEILRAENVERVVKGFALREYVFKQLVMIQSSSADLETYYQETAADISAGATRTVEEVPRLAKFPYGEVVWTKKRGWHKKFAFEGQVSWEDALTNNIDVVARTLLRIGRAVAKSVDAEIWDVLTEGRSVSNITNESVTAGYEWDSATIANRDPIQNILNAKKLISEQDYNPDSNGYLLLSPKDYANLLGNANIRNAGQFYTDDVTKNGRVGRLLGLTVLVSNNVTADYAAVVIAKECGTWKQVQPLTVKTIEDAGIKYVIRAWEIGSCQLTNPKAVCLIDNTQKT